ncbi:MAG: hypothetical protein HYT07_02695 [Candidatus Levybacteria bacterium]|nr:hypothetical protein [Candidatus Levybacteria bacterium]
MKNQNLVIAGVIALIIVLIGGFFILSPGKKTEPDLVTKLPIEEQITEINPEDIGLTLTASADNRKVILEVNKTEGLSGLDYELSYISKGDIPRGVIGHVDIEQEGDPVAQSITLGTCSDVCHYDEDVSDIKIIVKVSKTDGSTAQVEKSL